MQPGKYFRLSHFVPDGFPQIHPGMSAEVRQMMPALIEVVTSGWTKIPNHDGLEVFVTIKLEVPVLAFRKNGKEVYLHVFCNSFMHPIYAMHLVVDPYTKFKFGKPEFVPAEENWIHTIPVLPKDLNQAETLLTHQIAQSLFWTIYMDYKREKGK
jgi:hypothetical protein